MDLNLKYYEPKSYSRLNTIGRQNTTIDKVLTNMSVDIGSMMILRDKNELRSSGQCLRENLISDHLLLYSFIDFTPMASVRQPRIDKVTLITRVEEMNRQEISDMRKNFNFEFMSLRNKCIYNTISKNYIRPEKKLDEERI